MSSSAGGVAKKRPSGTGTLDTWLKRPCTAASNSSSPVPVNLGAVLPDALPADAAGADSVCELGEGAPDPSSSCVDNKAGDAAAADHMDGADAEAAAPASVPEFGVSKGTAALAEAGEAAVGPAASTVLVFALSGFAEDERDDLANELRMLSSCDVQVRVVPALDVQQCTHLMVGEDESLWRAATSEARRAAIACGIDVVTPAWLESARAPQTARPPSAASSSASRELEDGGGSLAAPSGSSAPPMVAPVAAPLAPPLAAPVASSALPASYVDAWDRGHVRLPCSPRCVTKEGTPVWTVICERLRSPPTSVFELCQALQAIRRALRGKWGLQALDEFLHEDLGVGERTHFFAHTLPFMCRTALRLPELFATPIELLLQSCVRRVELTQEQCCCLLCHAFFCTLPHRATDSRSPNLPYFAFCQLFGPLEPPRAPGSQLNGTQPQKLRCLLSYFEQMATRAAAGHPASPGQSSASSVPPVVFERLVLDTSETDLVDFWSEGGSPLPLCEVEARTSGTIEDAGDGVLQLDFANKVIGGGVLRNGCVQEEIRFLICPELIVSRLITEALADNEALLMSGFERFSSYEGYARTFAHAGPYEGPRLERPTLVAIDATHFGRHDGMRQFKADALERELNKALAGFSPSALPALRADTAAAAPSSRLLPVCTGNWGCGAFGGDLQLKALIQWAAASMAAREYQGRRVPHTSPNCALHAPDATHWAHGGGGTLRGTLGLHHMFMHMHMHRRPPSHCHSRTQHSPNGSLAFATTDRLARMMLLARLWQAHLSRTSPMATPSSQPASMRSPSGCARWTVLSTPLCVSYQTSRRTSGRRHARTQSATTPTCSGSSTTNATASTRSSESQPARVQGTGYSESQPARRLRQAASLPRPCAGWNGRPARVQGTGWSGRQAKRAPQRHQQKSARRRRRQGQGRRGRWRPRWRLMLVLRPQKTRTRRTKTDPPPPPTKATRYAPPPARDSRLTT